MILIGAGVSLVGTVLLAAMWMSNRGGDIRSHRDPVYTPERVDRFDNTPIRTL